MSANWTVSRTGCGARSGNWRRTRSSTMPANRRRCCRASNRCLASLPSAESPRGLSSASRNRRMTRQAKADIEESEEEIEELEEQIDELEAEAKEEMEELTDKWSRAGR